MERTLREYAEKLNQTNIELSRLEDAPWKLPYLKSTPATRAMRSVIPMNTILGMNELYWIRP